MSARVMAILGTRPEVVKLAPVIRALQADTDFEPFVCATAQHRDMLDLALGVFGIIPDLDLDVMQTNQELHEVTTRVLSAVTAVLREMQPDFVLVQGDTTSAMAAAMASFYEAIPVGHVEAGLRTGNMANPFPEEMNRRVISTVATLHFAPTTRAQEALRQEGVPEDRIIVTGNTVIDALTTMRAQAPGRSLPRKQLLVTAHRRESFGAPMEHICLALRVLALRNPDIEIVFPVHPNPQVRAPVNRLLTNLPNISLMEPLGYVEFIGAMRDAHIILTDSGGVQEEAPSLGKPVLILRDTTERPEAVEAGAARVVGTDANRIVSECENLLHDTTLYSRMASAANPFGDGHASDRILVAIKNWLGLFSQAGNINKQSA